VNNKIVPWQLKVCSNKKKTQPVGREPPHGIAIERPYNPCPKKPRTLTHAYMGQTELHRSLLETHHSHKPARGGFFLGAIPGSKHWSLGTTTTSHTTEQAPFAGV